jgi:hypothetical protein
MSERDRRSSSGPEAGAAQPAPPLGHAAPGKQTLVQRLGTVAAGPASGGGPQDPAQPANVHAAAARGVAGGSQPLPFAPTIQHLFGRHDIGNIQARIGASATAGARAMGAEAFATGSHVAFASTPDLHTTAHEAAHIVQQHGGVQLKGGVGEVGDPHEQHANQVADRVVTGASAEDLLDRYTTGGRSGLSAVHRAATGSAGPGSTVQRAPAATPSMEAAVSSNGMWEHTFGEASSPVGKLGRVQAPKGVYLRSRPLPGAESHGSPVPFNGLVDVERRTTQGHANERWCYVIATDAGAAGFCEERYLAIDPPEPTATLRRTAPGEHLAAIAAEAFGAPTDENNSRLQVQVLYLANRDRAGVKLDHVELGLKDRALRGDDEEQTLQIYKGAKVIEGASLWIPSKAFLEQLKTASAVSGGSTYVTEAWDKAKDVASGVVDGAKYVAGFVVGILEGAYNAVVDLFKGAVDMVEAVLKVIWNLVTGNLGTIKDMLMGWVGKMKLAWEHRGEIADEFLKKWNAESMWDRGVFQGDVLGWVMMTVLLILVTMGEDAPAAVAGIVTRWPQLVKLLKTVDTLGDVTTYVGAAAKAVKLPVQAVKAVTRDAAQAERAAAKAMKAGTEGERELAKLGTVMANKGSRLVHTPRAQAMHELLEEARRANVVIHSDEEAQRLLDWAARTAGAEPHTFHAVTIGDDIFVRTEHLANVRVLREELIHVFQQRAGMSSAEIVEKEIEARLMMIRYRHKWGITADEILEMIQEVRTMRKTGRY